MKVKLFGYVFSLSKDIPIQKEEAPLKMSFEDFKKLSIAEPTYSGNWYIDNEECPTWNDWYNLKIRPNYLSYQIFQLSKFPKVFKSFLKSVAEFNWSEVSDYMQSVNWTWNDMKTSPSVMELQLNVLDLLCDSLSEYDAFDNDVNCTGWASGGFKVPITHNEVSIVFDKSEGYVE